MKIEEINQLPLKTIILCKKYKSRGEAKMLYIIDRFEGKWAIINYNRETFNIPRDLIPSDAKEGDIITFDIKVDKEFTSKAHDEVSKLLESLMEDK